MPFVSFHAGFGRELQLTEGLPINRGALDLSDDELFVHMTSKESIPQGLKPNLGLRVMSGLKPRPI